MMFKNFKLILLFGSIFLLCVFEVLSLIAVKLPLTESAVVFGILLLFIGYRVFGKAIQACLRLDVRSVPILVTFAVLSGYLIGDRYEAMLVMLFCALADRLDDYGQEGQKNALDELLEKLPKYAYLRGMDEPIDVASISIGQEIVVKPNHVVPLDGEIISGRSSVDEMAITGEHNPVEKGPGCQIFAATFNGQGTLNVRVSKPLSASVLAQMHADATRRLQSKKPLLRLEERVIGYYAPLVFFGVLTSAIFQLLNGIPAFIAFINSLRFLLVACPSVVILSGPLATFFSSMRGESFGLRIDSSRAFEALAKIKAVVFTSPERSVLLPSLKKIGVAAALLTGNRESSQGFKVAKTGLLPADKVKEYELLAKKYKAIALIGEGVCDIPALVAADASVSVVPVGSVSLPDERMSELSKCIVLARHCVSIAHFNAVVAAVVKAGAIALFLLGAISSPGTIFLDLIAAFLIGAHCARLRD